MAHNPPGRFIGSFVNHYSKATENAQTPKSIRLLQDFLTQYNHFADAHDLAAHAICHFCEDDGRYNGNIAALLATTAFLQDQTGVKSSRAALVALKGILDGGRFTPESLRAWAEAHFPKSS